MVGRDIKNRRALRNMEEMSLVSEVCELIDRVKYIANQIRCYNDYITRLGLIPVLKEDDLKMPKLSLKSKPYSLQELNKQIVLYLDMMPRHVMDELAKHSLSDMQHSYYDNLDLYEAEVFLLYLKDLLSSNVNKAQYEVFPYGFKGISFCFMDEEHARKFIETTHQPGTLYEIHNDRNQLMLREIGVFG